METFDLYKASRLYNVIARELSLDMLHHCYMIYTPDDFVLDSFSVCMAKHIFCADKNAPCNECVNCIKVNHGNMVDLKIYPTSDKTLTVDDINLVVSDCYIKPIENEHKVYILKNFDLCTVQAQNKILKTLEEAPKGVVFILTCTNPSLVLATISSRAKKIGIDLLDTEVIEKYLQDIKCENTELIASMSGGNLSTALKLSKNKDAEDIVNLVFDMLLNLNSSADVLQYSSKILGYKKDIQFFLNTLISVLRDIARCDENINFKSKKKYVEVLATRFNAMAISQIVEIVIDFFERLEFNGNLNGLVDSLLLKILEVKFLCQK